MIEIANQVYRELFPELLGAYKKRLGGLYKSFDFEISKIDFAFWSCSGSISEVPFILEELTKRNIKMNPDVNRCLLSCLPMLCESLPHPISPSTIVCNSDGSVFPHGFAGTAAVARKSKLDEALQSMRDHHCLKDWSHKKSIFKLLYILCLPELRQFLHGFKLVEPNMEEIGLIIHHHALEGNLVELATLLMVYREKLMPLIACKSNDGLRCGDCLMIRQCIMREVQEQIDGEIRHMDRNPSGVLKCKKKTTKLIAAFQLLEVFEHAGDVIHDFLQSSGYSSTTKIGVANHVALLLKEKGFSLKKDILLDDLNLFSIDVEQEQSEYLGDAFVTNTSKPPLAFHAEAKAHTCVKRGRMKGGTTPSSFSCKDRGFYAFQMAPATLLLKSPLPVRTGASRSFEKLKPWISSLSSSRKWGCIASTMGGAKGVACYTPFRG